jgi:hypothetical protein
VANPDINIAIAFHKPIVTIKLPGSSVSSYGAFKIQVLQRGALYLNRTSRCALQIEKVPDNAIEISFPYPLRKIDLKYFKKNETSIFKRPIAAI